MQSHSLLSSSIYASFLKEVSVMIKRMCLFLFLVFFGLLVSCVSPQNDSMSSSSSVSVPPAGEIAVIPKDSLGEQLLVEMEALKSEVSELKEAMLSVSETKGIGQPVLEINFPEFIVPGIRVVGWYLNEELTIPFNGTVKTEGTETINLYPEWKECVVMDMMTVIPKGRTAVIEGDQTDGVFVEGREVVLSRPYEIGTFTVTQSQFEKVMKFNPSYFTSNSVSGENQEDRPVEHVSWFDAVAFCNELTRINMEESDCVYTITNIVKQGNKISSATVTADFDKAGYRLPTEAEWEFAARGGFEGGWERIYSGSDVAETVLWSADTSKPVVSHEVGKKGPNALGLYDMSGNIWEWCWDKFQTIEKTTEENPAGPDEGLARIHRGGSYGYRNSYCTVSSRGMNNPDQAYDVGLRVCRTLK